MTGLGRLALTVAPSLVHLCFSPETVWKLEMPVSPAPASPWRAGNRDVTPAPSTVRPTWPHRHSNLKNKSMVSSYKAQYLKSLLHSFTGKCSNWRKSMARFLNELRHSYYLVGISLRSVLQHFEIFTELVLDHRYLSAYFQYSAII